MLLVHAGNRVDADGDGSPGRFPAGQVPYVRYRLGRLLAHLRPDVVVSAAAAGSDLVVLQEALRLGLAVHVVLPFARETFRERSVADRGGDWAEAFDRVLDTVTGGAAGCALVEHDLPGTAAGFRQGNQILLDHARALRGEGGALAVAVRPRDPQGPPSVTDDFVERAQEQGLPWIDLDPGVRPGEQRSAFVAMPFGVKPHGAGSVDCDRVFGTLVVPALEDADLRWERADAQVDTGIIHVGMIERLGNADVVVVDTVTRNPNVFYELGLRHCLADRTTVLLGPAGDPPPFDVRPIRHFTYRLTDGVIDESSAGAAVQTLRAVLDPERLEHGRRDSPVFEFFQVQRQRLRVRGDAEAGVSRSLELHQQVTAAVTGRDVARLRALLGDVRTAEIDEDQRRQLLLRAGAALRELGRYEEAVDALRVLDLGPDHGSFVLWVQQLALALRRRGEADLAGGRDPEPAWTEAQDLLDRALRLGDDPESCGIAAGLQKRRGLRALTTGDRSLAAVHIRAAAELYERGFAAEPSDYYTGSNAIASLRLLAQRLGGPPDLLARAQRLAPVVEFFAERAAGTVGDPFWPRVTTAELALSRHLLHGDPDLGAVEDAYLRATVLRPAPDQVRAVLDQFDLYHRLGDPPELLERLAARFRPLLPQRRAAQAAQVSTCPGPPT